MRVGLSKFSYKWLRPCAPVSLLDCQMQRPLWVGGEGAKAKPTYCPRPFFLGGHLGPQFPWGQDPFSWGIGYWLNHSLSFSAESIFLSLFATDLENTMFSKGMTSYTVYILPLDHNNDLGRNCYFTYSI